MDQFSQRDRRQFYRLVYPTLYRPILKIGVYSYEAYDVSEFGVRIFCRDMMFRLQEEVSGILVFHDGEEYVIHGTVIRQTKDFVIIKLDVGIPEKKILEEQRQLINVLRKLREDQDQRAKTERSVRESVL